MVRRYSKKDINILAEILKKDGVISVPTDTVYGLCASINSVKAHKKLVEIKNRPNGKPFPIMCADEAQIESIAKVSERVKRIIRNLMPGPITLVLEKKADLANYINNGKNTIAVRMATSNELRELIEKVGCPIFMTSANQSGKNVCKSIDEIEKVCPDLDGVLEGEVSFNEPSTIVDCTSEDIKILRDGPISLYEILEIM